MGGHVCDLLCGEAVMTVCITLCNDSYNYHGICTAHQSVHNSNPGVLATPAAIYKARS